MKDCRINEGFSSVEILVTLFVLSILVAAFSYLLSFQKLKVTKYKNEEKARNQIELCFEEFNKQFIERLNFDYDGPEDEIYGYVSKTQPDIKVYVKSLSGLVDMNFLPVEFYSKPYFISFLKENADTTFMENFRNSNKFITSYADVSDFIEKPVFDKNISLYSLVNINTADDNSLYYLCDVYNCSSNLLDKRKSLIFNKQYMHTETESSLYYGLDYDRLRPYVSVEAPLNVNFAEEDFLKSLLSLSRFQLKNSEQKCSELCSERESHTLSKENICNILGISNNDELYYYVGCNTYFWEIIIATGIEKCRYVLFRNDKKVYLINKRWL